MSLVSELMQVHVDAVMHLRGDRVGYSRARGGGPADAFLTAARGKTDHDERTPEGMVVSVEVPDWLIEVVEFELVFGKGALPEDDDVITFAGQRYLVKPIEGERCYVRQQGDAMFRVHTKWDGRA